MEQRDKLQEERKRIVLAGENYKRKRAFFDSLTDEDGQIRMHFAGKHPGAAWKYMLYDRGSEGGIYLEDARIEGDCLTFSDIGHVLDGYEEGVRRYTVIAVDVRRKSACVFLYKKAPKTDEYDSMGNMLCSGVIGQAPDGQRVEGIYYIADEERLLRLVVQKEYLHLKSFLEAKIEKVQLRRGKLVLHAALKDYGFTMSRIYMRLRSKTEVMEYDFQVKTQKKGDSYHIIASIQLPKLHLTQFYWDIKGVVVRDNIPMDINLKNKDLWIHRIMYLKQMRYVYPDGNIVYPYKTKSNEFALQFRAKTEQDCWAFIFKEYLALLIYYLGYFWLKHKNIWLVYEKYCVMAQDNSFYFFKYCMEQLPESERKRIFYVIDKKAPDYQYVKQYGENVIDFLSLKHMVYLMAARLLISSDTKAHAYAWHSPHSVYRNMLKRKENVFLQHGVIAFKCCHQGLRKKSVNASNLFVVSSDVEKQIILDNFGYDEDEILVTGLARWDVLKDKSKGQPRQIILMPTWRTWLEEVSEEEFVASDYYRHYMSVLNNQILLDTLEKHQIILNFYIHPKFREYMGAFKADSEYVRLIPFGSEPLNELMMKCSMMITDYSSAVWDVFYQGKPVAFYLFDLELYNEVQGSYIDMETEAFGDVVHTPEELAELIRSYAENGFKEKEAYGRMRETQIAYIDDKNSERTYKEIAKRYRTSLKKM